MQTANGTVNPLSTITTPIPNLRGAADPNGVEFTLAASGVYNTGNIEVESFPCIFAISSRNVTNPGNQSICGFIYMNSPTSSPLITSGNALTTTAGTPNTLVPTRPGATRSLALTLQASSDTYAFRLVRLL